MRIERVRNAARNLAYGAALQGIRLVLPFLLRTAMLYVLGAEYLGLSGLFASVFHVLNLAELGVGSAMVYSMYRPIAEDDAPRICALMGLYKIYYRVIGLVVGVLGLALLPVLPRLIQGDVPAAVDLRVLYLLHLASVVLSYWFFAHQGSVLLAHQRTDRVSKAALITELLRYGAQLGVLVWLKSYYLYLVTALIFQGACNLLTAWYAKRLFPQYRARGTLPPEEQKIISRRVRDLFTAKFSTVVVYNSDPLVISAFMGLTALAVYQNYYYLFSGVSSVIAIVYGAVRAGVGNSLIVDTKEKVFEDFQTFLLIIAWIAGVCCTCFLCLYQPFMALWVGQELLMETSCMVCMVVYFYVHCINVFLNSYKDAAGLWREDRFRPLVTALTNLALNILLIRKTGLYGVILSTVVSLVFVGMPWLVKNLFCLIFHRKDRNPFLRRLGWYTVCTFLVASGSYGVCGLIRLPLFQTVAVRLVLCLAESNLCFWMLYHRLPEFSRCVQLAKRLLRGK